MWRPIQLALIGMLYAWSVSTNGQETQCEASLFSVSTEPGIAEAMSQVNTLDVRILPTDASATCNYDGVDFRDPAALDGTPCRVKVVVLGDNVAITPDTLPALFRQRHLALANVEVLEIQGRRVSIDAPLNFSGTTVVVTAKYLELQSGAAFFFPSNAPGRLTLAAEDLELSGVLDGIPVGHYPYVFFGLKASPLTVLARRVFAPESVDVRDVVTLKRFLHNLSSDRAISPDVALAWIEFDNTAAHVDEAVYGTSYWPFYTLSRFRSAHARVPYAADTVRGLLPTLRAILNELERYSKLDPRRAMLVEGYATLIERIGGRLDSNGLSAYYTPGDSFQAEYARFRDAVALQLGANGLSDQWMRRFNRILISSASSPWAVSDEANRLEQSLRTKQARLQSLQSDEAQLRDLIERAEYLNRETQDVLQETAQHEIEYRKRLSEEQEEEALARTVLSTVSGIAVGVYTGNPMIGMTIQQAGINAGDPNISDKQRAATLLAAGYRIYQEETISDDAVVAQNERESAAAYGEAIEMFGRENLSDVDYAKIFKKLAEGYTFSSNAAQLAGDRAREASMTRMANQAQAWSASSSDVNKKQISAAILKGLEAAESDLLNIREDLITDADEKTTDTGVLDIDLEATKQESTLKKLPEGFFPQSKALSIEEARASNLASINEQIVRIRTLIKALASGDLNGKALSDTQSLLKELQSSLSKEQAQLAHLGERQRSESSRLYSGIVGHLERAENALAAHEQARKEREKKLEEFIALMKAQGIDTQPDDETPKQAEELPPYLAEALSRVKSAQSDLKLLQEKALGVSEDINQLEGEVFRLEVERAALNTLRSSELVTKGREQALNRMYYAYLNVLTDDLDLLAARAVRAKAYWTLDPPSETCAKVLQDSVLKPQSRIDLVLGENVRERDLATLRALELEDLRLHYTRVESACLSATITPDRQTPKAFLLAVSNSSDDAAGRALIRAVNRAISVLVADIGRTGSRSAQMAVSIPPSLFAQHIESVKDGRLGGAVVAEVLFKNKPNDKQVVELSIRRPRAGYMNVSSLGTDNGKCTLFDFRHDTRSQQSPLFFYGVKQFRDSVSMPPQYLVGSESLQSLSLTDFSGLSEDMPLYPLGSEFELVVTLKGYTSSSGFASSTPSIERLQVAFEYLSSN